MKKKRLSKWEAPHYTVGIYNLKFITKPWLYICIIMTCLLQPQQNVNEYNKSKAISFIKEPKRRWIKLWLVEYDGLPMLATISNKIYIFQSPVYINTHAPVMFNVELQSMKAFYILLTILQRTYALYRHLVNNGEK